MGDTRHACLRWEGGDRELLLAQRGQVAPGSALYGKAFENRVCHELAAYLAYSDSFEPLGHWRLAGGTEVGFIVGPERVAIESKATKRVTSDHLEGLRSLVRDHPDVGPRFVVCLEPKTRSTDDGITVLPAGRFARRLWRGELI